jgi:hypothetical protein
MSQLSTKLPWDLAQTKWASTINPVLALPILNGGMIEAVNLTANVPRAINHLLQRLPQGWMLTDNRKNAVVWRSADFNDLTLTLTASADTTISFWVF